MIINRAFVQCISLMTLCVATCITGCGGGVPKANVSGTVTFDGKPIKDGSIEFFPVNGQGQSAGVSIKDGQYTTTASVGEMKVTINAMEVTGQRKAYDTPESPMIDIVRNPIPAWYNTASELKVTLVAGSNTQNFELKSKKDKK